MNKEEIYNTLIEVQSLFYVLETALSNDEQPANDTNPYACLVKLIKYKIADLTEMM